MKLVERVKNWLIVRWITDDLTCPLLDSCKQDFYEDCDNTDDCMQNAAELRGP
jgi:hypothetical protein